LTINRPIAKHEGMKKNHKVIDRSAVSAVSGRAATKGEPDTGRGEASRRALLLAGLEVFGEKGLAGASTREIAAKAGQNLSAILYYFNGKDGLYLAIAQEIANQMKVRLGPAIEEIERAQHLTPDAAREMLCRYMSVLVRSILGNSGAIGQFIMREQQHPTAAFDILYNDGMARVHSALNRLLACVLGTHVGDKETMVRAHALFGQILVFQAARELILRRTKWSDLGAPEIALVEASILANIDSFCASNRSGAIAKKHTSSALSGHSTSGSRTRQAKARRT
jgi:TetR/AcrR family transcriptional regulator, regulator of cefoperazone and chloramphenicol sensitivity